MLTRWEPLENLWREKSRMHTEMNRMFERFGLGEFIPRALALSFPTLNIWENDDKVFVEAELPGVEKDALEIYVNEGNQLTLKGERKPLDLGKGLWHRQERGFGAFSRVVALPVAVDADKVEARFEHGVLFLTLPKSPKAKPRRIAVQGESSEPKMIQGEK